MATENFEAKIKTYQFTAIFSIIFALVGFSYNTWRLEVSEDNSNIRTASFQVLSALSELEQLIYIGHYDMNTSEGNPRIGWIKIGLINDLSALIDDDTQHQAEQLRQLWADKWHSFNDSRSDTDQLVAAIDAVRAAIKVRLGQLQ
ncbi:hypothetical protein SIN8267_02462 [Sinobacterium norvegicum]|uniref:Uncharacterized protein n=1 Tax=Sinobacterium norvegicum TaxID=1641715 RepID=A0ABM9AH19_9GAMM|nr:hypothetical protein [Sinobacterium norvegicum]CAH0992343.1 hypothetical protein SIN8267_02462 [Sinobacterium norvegicum]